MVVKFSLQFTLPLEKIQDDFQNLEKYVSLERIVVEKEYKALILVMADRKSLNQSRRLWTTSCQENFNKPSKVHHIEDRIKYISV